MHCSTLVRVAILYKSIYKYTNVGPTLFFCEAYPATSYSELSPACVCYKLTDPDWCWQSCKCAKLKLYLTDHCDFQKSQLVNIQNCATQNCIVQDLNFLKDCLSYKSRPDLLAELHQENYIAQDFWQSLNLNLSCKSRPDFTAELWQEFEQTVQTPWKCLPNLERPNVEYCSYIF